MSTVIYPHIEIDGDGHARIRGTGFKVRVLAEEHVAAGADALDLHRCHPNLTLAQIYSALAYYYDHKEDFDREIEELSHLNEQVRAQQGESLFAKKVRDLGKEMP
jgi:uncharacterized protein (DUF433 family)